ncbi:aldose 1-epimerase [Pelosinus fermentans]|uniref:Aldose 1-epimerase n=2 Tax=Sporomusaceae TaxID=1843490 RepID=I8RIH0_9FIRM|nr:Aldose 1-epimerase [Pelosinus fermentans B4]EIW23772.1 Aldose 1-epimerase [Pelosinus fermentans A11]OAM94695.1 Aldose 1-epimerase [Pelosinus fermentans DSM 17108]SDR15598.1 aldose 1-epimerase [Pelosinus fermentans]
MMSISKRLFGKIDEQEVCEYTFKNDNGIEISCLNYGCIITKVIVPDRRGNYENIVIGFQELADYQRNPLFAGAVVGRVAGRIRDAQFELEGKNYTLPNNDGHNNLHSGPNGFQNAVWDAAVVSKEQEDTIEFSHTSLDGVEGYPGTLTTKVTYTLNNNNEFSIHYYGVADEITLFNPTNHTYFNLSGNFKQDISQHSLKIDSSRFLELTQQLLPTGKLLDVTDTVFDFRTGRKIIEGINSINPQNTIAGQGYDHPFILDSNHNGEIVLQDEESGRVLTIETDAVGVVLYTGNHIPSDFDIHGVKSRPYLGLCLETQGLPDAIHHSHFPSCILQKNQISTTTTTYTFSVVL